MDIKKKIGSRIKALRLINKLTQEALAFKAGIDKTYVNEVENGKRNISIVNLEKIIVALDQEFNTFFDDLVFSKNSPTNGE
ncbi:helix-turn-helix domain-containing protein [Pedobacter sp. UC225_61]|uniref:helix-turn-helix domain-containing protein n=1 Tax=Pedobacter sp. UC225_61 TaxID=3374623 RepID=UPI0037AD0A9D